MFFSKIRGKFKINNDSAPSSTKKRKKKVVSKFSLLSLNVILQTVIQNVTIINSEWFLFETKRDKIKAFFAARVKSVQRHLCFWDQTTFREINLDFRICLISLCILKQFETIFLEGSLQKSIRNIFLTDQQRNSVKGKKYFSNSWNFPPFFLDVSKKLVSKLKVFKVFEAIWVICLLFLLLSDWNKLISFFHFSCFCFFTS